MKKITDKSIPLFSMKKKYQFKPFQNNDLFAHICPFLFSLFCRKNVQFLHRTVSLMPFVCAATMECSWALLVIVRTLLLQGLCHFKLCNLQIAMSVFAAENFTWTILLSGIFFERRKASKCVSFIFHSGVCDDSYVLLFKHFMDISLKVNLYI